MSLAWRAWRPWRPERDRALGHRKNVEDTLPAVLGLVPRLSFALAAVAALLVAGCVTAPNTATNEPGPDAAAAEWPAKVIVYGEGHDHRDWSQHVNMSTPNFQKLAYDPLSTERYDGASAAGYFCGGEATTPEGRKLAVISSLDSDVAFVLIDVTDPTKPQKVGEYVVDGTTHYDVDITSDGRYVVIGSDPDPGFVTGLLPTGLGVDALAEAPKMRTAWRDACGNERVMGPEESLPLAPATILVDISDLSNPTIADVLPAPVFGPHSVSTATVDGVHYVASSITNLAQPADYFQFSRIDQLPTGGKLTLLSTVDGAMYGAGGTAGGHVDAEIAVHPATGQMLAYLSNWDGGMVILDLTTPEVPMLLGEWADEGASNGALHSTRSVEGLWDGRHYVIAGQEFIARPEDRGSGWIYIIDDTDPANPTEVARWTLPLDTEPLWAGDTACCLETWSTHYFRLVGRTLFVSMYHGGLWAVDLSDPAQPRSAGVFMPDQAPPQPRRDPTGFYDLTPFVLDSFPSEDHTISVFDGYSGLYMVKYDPTVVVPRVPEWPMTGAPHADG